MKVIRSKKQLFVVAFVLILAIGLVIFRQVAPGAYSSMTTWLTVSQPGLYTVTDVADGDTITVRQGDATYRIRLIGVDTPETQHPDKGVQCFGREAADYTRSLLENEEVRLEADILSDNKDRYQRLLRYVYLPDEEVTPVNQRIIEDGYGVSYRSFLHSKLEAFEESEARARSEQKGLWRACQPERNEHGVFGTGAATE